MQVFASYIGLALHHAKLYDKIKKNEQKYKVVQEVVNYQSTAPQHEVQEVEPFQEPWVQNDPVLLLSSLLLLTNTRIGWELKFITIAQIMDEGMVKPEDHQDVATQM